MRRGTNVSMDHRIKWTGLIVVGLAGLLQWSVLLDRLAEAIWGWYKFREYGGGGELTVSVTAQVQFFVGSTFLAMLALLLAKKGSDKQRDTLSRIASCVFVAVVAGMVLWGAVLTSPLTTWRPEN